MIVVDANVLAYLLIPGKYTESAENLLQADPDVSAGQEPLLFAGEVAVFDAR